MAVLPRPAAGWGGQAARSRAPADHAVSVATPGCPANPTASEAAPSAAQRVRVMLPLPLPEPLDYLPPADIAMPEPGSFVRVALGSRRVIGVAWDGVEDEES